MRQRQLFLDAQRRASSSSSSSSSSSTSMSTITRLLKSVWTSISSRFRPVADNQQSKSSFYGVLSFSPLAISVIMAMTLGIGIRIGMEIPHQPSSLPTTIPYNSYSSYSIPMLRCIPLGLLHLPQYSHHAWNVVSHAVINKLVAFHSVVVMGLVSTAVSGCALFVLLRPPVCSGSENESSSSCVEQTDSEETADVKFESVFYEEYDTMMSLVDNNGLPAASAASAAAFSAVNVITPRCELVITYVPARSAFGYYTDRKDSLPYTHLETAARIFLVKNARPDLAKLAYVDRRKKKTIASVEETPTSSDSTASTATSTSNADTVATAGGEIFSLFKSYNRKPVSDASKESTSTSDTSSVPPPVVDTHFVYMGSMEDYRQLKRASEPRTRASGSSASGDEASEAAYVNIKYADFKKKVATTTTTTTRQT